MEHLCHEWLRRKPYPRPLWYYMGKWLYMITLAPLQI